MPAAFIGPAIGAVGAIAGASGGGSNSNAVAAASPFQQFFPQQAQNLSNQANNGTFGQGVTGGNTINGLDSFVNNQSAGLTGALNGQQYASQLNNLVANPGSVQTSAGYQAALNQGLSAVQSQGAAAGLNGSGNQMAALQNYGQSFEQNSYNNQLSQLSGLYGQSLGANQQQFNQASGINTQSYNQLAQLAGLQGNQALNSAGQLTAQGNQQTSQAVSSGISGLANAGQGLVNNGTFGGVDSNSFAGALAGTGATTSQFDQAINSFS